MMDDAQVAEFIRRVRNPTPAELRKTHRANLRRNLPRRARIRLAATGRITSLGIWLCDHDHCGLAEALWRACGMW